MVLIFTPFATMQKNKSTERQNKKFQNTSHQLNVAQNLLISNLPFPTYAAIIPVFRKKYRIGQMKSYPELHNLWQRGSVVRRSPPRRSPPQTFTTPSVKSDVHHPRRSPPQTFTTPCVKSDVHHPRHSPPQTFTTSDVHHPRHSPPQTFTTPSVKSDVHHPRHSPPQTFTTSDVHHPRHSSPPV